MRQKTPNYQPQLAFRSAHINTIFPYLARKVDFSYTERERIETSDGDFLDLDWKTQSSSKLVILSHGLEGSSKQAYIKGMGKMFFKSGLDILAWNFRSCSGEINKRPHFYHSGFTTDLERVINQVLKRAYQEIYLIGFSMGGNQTLKYLGENGNLIPKEIKKAMVISVPMDLESCAKELAKLKNKIYMQSFLLTLKRKVKMKSKKDPHYPLNLKDVLKCKSFYDFDEIVTAKLHQYSSAKEYWKENSAVRFVEGITRPTLILNSYDDPFLGEGCFPLVKNPSVTTIYTDHGGHVGFVDFNPESLYYSEQIAKNFILGPL